MDDLYNNLENYKDSDRIDKLANENKELKEKIDEYAYTISKLQNDLDKLSTEFKNLESNYSSLLKTAKAEIERKTQIITTLNAEKDMLVLSSIQNTGRNVFKKANNVMKSKHAKSSDKDLSIKDMQKQAQSTNSRNNENCISVPVSDTIERKSSREKNIPDKCDKDMKNTPKTDKKSMKSTENHTQNSNYTKERHSDTKVKTIINRRKSVPVMNYYDAKFSSDEEGENSTTTDELRCNISSRDKEVRNTMERSCDNNKLSESSSLDDRYSNNYCEQTRGNHFKSNRFIDNEKYGFKNKYENTQRHRRQYSPEKSYYRSSNNYISDYNQGFDYYQKRVPESPPKEKSYSQARVRDFQSCYERDHYRNAKTYNRETSRNSKHFKREFQDCNSFRYDKEKCGVKHKLQADVEESSHKRFKPDFQRHHKEEKSWEREQNMEKNPINLEPLDDISCQSPDYVYYDNSINAAPIKEIKYTAVTKIDDPRIKSTKYVLTTENGKVLLSTVTGRNVNIATINKAHFDMELVPVPAALERPPVEFKQEKNINIIHMDVDYVESNFSLESGEISTGEGHLMNNIYGKNLTKPRKLRTDKILINHTEDTDEKVKNKTKAYANENIVLKPESNYDINKMKEVIDNLSDDTISKINITSIPNLIKSVDNTCNQDKSVITQNENKFEYNSKADVKNGSINIPIDTELIMPTRIVEDDLVLSDEASDIVEPQNSLRNGSNKQEELNEFKHNQDENIDVGKSITITCDKDKLMCASKENVSIDLPDNDKEFKTVLQNNEKNDLEQSSRDCSVIYKGMTNSDYNEELKTEQSLLKKKKREQEIKAKKIKTKFIDLFDDSNISLITPDDLGINDFAKQSPKQYRYFYENNEDAVDINMGEVKKIDSQSKTNNESIRKDEMLPPSKIKDNSSTSKIFDTKTKEKLEMKDILLSCKADNSKIEEKSQIKGDSLPDKICITKEQVNSKIKDNLLPSKICCTKLEEKINIKDNSLPSKMYNFKEEEKAKIKDDSLPNKVCISKERIKDDLLQNKVSNSEIKYDSLPDKISSIKKEDKLKIKDSSLPNKVHKTKKKEKEKVTKRMLKKNDQKEPVFVPQTLDIVNVFNNISTKTSNYSKTIVISTGVQSQVVIENTEGNINNHMVPVNNMKNIEINPLINQSLKALATSTPSKQIHEAQETESILPNCSISNNNETVNYLPPVEQSSDCCTESLNNTDTPDIRIFVKRRRNLKKPTTLAVGNN